MERLPVAPAYEPVRIAISYPLTAVVFLTGAVTALVLELGGAALRPAHWVLVLLTSALVTVGLHLLPACLRSVSVFAKACKLAWDRHRLLVQAARLEKVEIRERLRNERRERAIAERSELLVRTFEYYRAAARATGGSQLASAA